jgi:hypothetical protein
MAILIDQAATTKMATRHLEVFDKVQIAITGVASIEISLSIDNITYTSLGIYASSDVYVPKISTNNIWVKAEILSITSGLVTVGV